MAVHPPGATLSRPCTLCLICFGNVVGTRGSVEAERRGSCQRVPCASALMNLIRLPVSPVPLPTACVLALIYRHHVHLSREWRLAQIKARRPGELSRDRGWDWGGCGEQPLWVMGGSDGQDSRGLRTSFAVCVWEGRCLSDPGRNAHRGSMAGVVSGWRLRRATSLNPDQSLQTPGRE